MYHPQEELNLELDEGFRARPSIGAAAILSRVQENDPFWVNIFNAIDFAKAGTEVRIFLLVLFLVELVHLVSHQLQD